MVWLRPLFLCPRPLLSLSSVTSWRLDGAEPQGWAGLGLPLSPPFLPYPVHPQPFPLSPQASVNCKLSRWPQRKEVRRAPSSGCFLEAPELGQGEGLAALSRLPSSIFGSLSEPVSFVCPLGHDILVPMAGSLIPGWQKGPGSGNMGLIGRPSTATCWLDSSSQQTLPGL